MFILNTDGKRDSVFE